jgi:hypothetical protein
MTASTREAEVASRVSRSPKTANRFFSEAYPRSSEIRTKTAAKTGIPMKRLSIVFSMAVKRTLISSKLGGGSWARAALLNKKIRSRPNPDAISNANIFELKNLLCLPKLYFTFYSFYSETAKDDIIFGCFRDSIRY